MEDVVQVLESAQRLYEAECLQDSFYLVQTLISKKNLDILEKSLFLCAKICEAKSEFRLAIDYYSKTAKCINVYSLDDIHYRMAKCLIKLKSFREAEDVVILNTLMLKLSEIPEMSRSDAVWKLLATVYENLGQQKYLFMINN